MFVLARVPSLERNSEQQFVFEFGIIVSFLLDKISDLFALWYSTRFSFYRLNEKKGNFECLPFVNNETSRLWWRCEMKIAQRHRKWKSKSGSQSSSPSRWLRFGSIVHASRGSFLCHIMVFCRSQQGRWDFPMSHSIANLLVLLRPLMPRVFLRTAALFLSVYLQLRGWCIFRSRPPVYLGRSSVNHTLALFTSLLLWSVCVVFVSALLAAHLEPRFSVCGDRLTPFMTKDNSHLHRFLATDRAELINDRGLCFKEAIYRYA